MTEQIDWVSVVQKKPFRDIRRQRDTTAEQKAELCLRIGKLCNTVPACVRNGSVDKTREWKAERLRAMKVAGSARSSINDLTAAISNMERFA